MSGPLRQLITVDTAAKMLGVSRRTVYTFISRGELETVRLSPSIRRVKVGSVEGFIDRHTVRRLGRSGERRAQRAG